MQWLCQMVLHQTQLEDKYQIDVAYTWSPRLHKLKPVERAVPPI